MFDLNRQWFVNKTEGNGHIGHREGISADINRADETGVAVNCETDLILRQALTNVNAQLPPGGKIRLVCESGGRKHVDF